MAAIKLEITTANGERTMRLIKEQISPRAILTVIGARFLSFVDESFRTRGRGSWRPLAMSTLALRQKGGDAPLQDTGRYKQSYVRETDDRTFVEVGTNLRTQGGISLGKIHEFGTGSYKIRIRRAKVLAARARGGGFFFFGTEVNHPGISARPVLPTKAVAERLVQQTLDAMLERVITSNQ